MKDETTLASVDNIIETVKEITEYQYIEEDTRDESMEEIKQEVSSKY